jgi:S-adenosyl-l-methionine hydroxide adenosyltransferase
MVTQYRVMGQDALLWFVGMLWANFRLYQCFFRLECTGLLVATCIVISSEMIVLFTDFGLEGPYAGQMKAVLHPQAPGVPIVDLFADAPVGNPKASA